MLLSRSRRVPALLAAGVAALGAAVVATSSASADESDGPQVDLDASLTNAVYPTGDPLALMTTPVLSTTLEQNFQASVQGCVERLGFDYATPDPGVIPVGSGTSPNASTGYGIVVSHLPATIAAQVDAEADARDTNLDYADTLPQKDADLYLDVIGETDGSNVTTSGEPATCKAAANEEILQPAVQAQTELAEKTLQIADRLEDRADVKTADQSWSQCMDGAGYNLASPMDAEQVIADAVTGTATPDLDQILAQEKVIASADASCRTQTGYMKIVDKAAVQEWQSASVDQAVVDTAAGAIQ